MEKLNAYLPTDSIPLIKKWIEELDIAVKIKKSRNTKLGDFRVTKKREYLISINNDLNEYAFLITLTHEIAHAFVWKKYKRKVCPHGAEWKNTLKKMMLNFLNSNIFPDDILRALSKHIKNPKASTANDYNLSRILKNYDKNPKQTIDEIPDGSIFSTVNGKQFMKIEKLRKRYKCQEIVSEKIYLFNPLAIVNISHNN
tara:strand:+ start:644 stop:1240 length:597 start_codon:yes stop_codon:yes gene_type:complete